MCKVLAKRSSCASLAWTAGDMRPYRCADSHEEGQKSEPVRLIGPVEVSVEHEVSEVGLVAVPQVHEQESKIVEHINCGEVLVELEAVEERRLALETGRCSAGSGRRDSGAPSPPRAAPFEQRRMAL